VCLVAISGVQGVIALTPRWRANFFEKYVDEAAFELHGKTPYFTAFAAALDELMSGDLEIQFLRELI
jgi:quinol monooxygenase YgiN